MSNDEKLLTVKDAMYRSAKDLESGALWTSQAIASIAELAGIDKRCTHSQALIAFQANWMRRTSLPTSRAFALAQASPL